MGSSEFTNDEFMDCAKKEIDLIHRTVNRQIEAHIKLFLRSHRTHRLNIMLVCRPTKYDFSGMPTIKVIPDFDIERIKPEGWVAPLP